MFKISKLFICLSLLFVSPTLSQAQEIHEAVRNNDIEAVKTILSKAPDLLNSKDAGGKTPLHIAAEKGFDEIVKLLLKKGAEVNSTTNFNTTPLHYAALNNQLAIVKLLVENGAELEIKNYQFATPLYYAAMKGNLEIVQYLIENKANVDALDREEGTPLHSAAQAGHFDVVKLLVKYDAEKNKKDLNGRTALHFACISGNQELVEFLVKNGLNVSVGDNFGKTPLYCAAEKGHQSIVDFLLSYGRINVNHFCQNGSSYLHAAAIGGLESFAKILVDDGAVIDHKNIDGLTALHSAAMTGHKEVVVTLATVGATLNTKNFIGQTPFHLALEGKHNEIVEALASYGADTSAWQFPEFKNNYLELNEPGMEPKIFAPGIVSTSTANERDVTFSPDLNEFYFTRNGKIQSMKKIDGKWTAPATASFSDEYKCFEACFTPDGQQLFFISKRPKSGTDAPESWNIWFVERKGNDWNVPKPLGAPFEGSFYPTFTRDWIMYYTTADNDLYRSRLKNGEFDQPEKLGSNINTAEAEYNSFVAADESYLIFTSHGWGKGFGEYDLYVCFKRKDGTWTKAKNMGPKINSFARDYCPSISPDGKYFFFSSSRLGNEDIFWVDAKIIEELK